MSLIFAAIALASGSLWQGWGLPEVLRPQLKNLVWNSTPYKSIAPVNGIKLVFENILPKHTDRYFQRQASIWQHVITEFLDGQTKTRSSRNRGFGLLGWDDAARYSRIFGGALATSSVPVISCFRSTWMTRHGYFVAPMEVLGWRLTGVSHGEDYKYLSKLIYFEGSVFHEQVTPNLSLPDTTSFQGCGFGCIGSTFSFARGVAGVPSRHIRSVKSAAANQQASAGQEQLPPTPLSSSIARVRSLPLSAKIGGAIVFAALAACVWAVGAKRSYERGDGWWRDLLGSLIGGWALLLSAVALVGLSGPC